MRDDETPYRVYARHYDAIGQRVFGERSAENLLAYLRLNGHAPVHVLDAACGTGAAALSFARAGLTVTGVDNSIDMLEIARTNATKESLSVTFESMDITALIVKSRVDLVTCFYDAVNYLSSLEQVSAFVQSSFDALRSGGVLAFDINTRRKLTEFWHDATVIASDTDERFITYQSWYDEETSSSPLIITIFEHTNSNSWSRFREVHTEYAYAIGDIERALQNAGFASIEVLNWREGNPDFLTTGTEESYRVLFLATRTEAET
jgi:SAM-dependent methyltransferase